MKAYETPEILIVSLTVKDIITTSKELVPNGLFDDDNN